MFRSFIYFDQDKIYSYLRQIDKDFANQPSEITKKKTKGGSMGLSYLGAKTETEIEERQEIYKDFGNDYDRFEKKLAELSGEEYFDFALENYDVDTIPNMSIIRIHESLEVPQEFDMFNLAQNFMPLITSQIQTSSSSEHDMMEAFLGKAAADIPIVTECDELTLSGKLSTLSLVEEYEQLEDYAEQEVYILCRVVGKIQKEKVEIFNPLKDFIRLPRAVRRGADINNDELQSIIIDGPVLKIEVLAIYK